MIFALKRTPHAGPSIPPKLPGPFLVLLALGGVLGVGAGCGSPHPTRPYGLAERTVATAYLNMPQLGSGTMPALLSQTGAFKDTRNLVPADGLIPYDLVVAFWSDGAVKTRWVSVPGKIDFAPTGEWRFPKGTVFVKTFELPTAAGHAAAKRRLETRLLVCDASGGVYGVVYKWRPDNSDAELLSGSLTEDITVHAAAGESQQTWYYPSRKDCLTCHTSNAGGVLGVKTRQLNHDFTYPTGVTDNELRTWNHLGLFTPSFKESELGRFSALAAANDASRTLEDRARSYLDANCSQCHRPRGTAAYFDARYDTPLDKQGLVDGPIVIDEGIDRPRVIAPHDIWRSLAFMRIDTDGDLRMPPLARETIDQGGVALMRQWIESLPGREVLAPPRIAPAGGNFGKAVVVTLDAAEPGADIRYTLDGSEPGPSDVRFDKPIKLTQTTMLRARAYKDGFTHSITTQQLFVIGQ
jgi:uncharacterized repeat protein (TIGR03806 family)